MVYGFVFWKYTAQGNPSLAKLCFYGNDSDELQFF